MSKRTDFVRVLRMFALIWWNHYVRTIAFSTTIDFMNYEKIGKQLFPNFVYL